MQNTAFVETDNHESLGSNGNFLPPSDLMDVFDIAMVRPRKNWIAIPSPVQGGTFLQFGGENKTIEGYIEINYPDWDAETLIPVPYPEDSVDAVVCTHTLDHLSAKAVEFWLTDMSRILKPGGTVSIIVPHFMSTLAFECIEHKTRYGLKTFRNLLGGARTLNVEVDGVGATPLRIGFNMVMGVEERNLILVTQLVKDQ